jgi:ubiquinol-cytochrome c reductase cytochrome c1 subunit
MLIHRMTLTAIAALLISLPVAAYAADEAVTDKETATQVPATPDAPAEATSDASTQQAKTEEATKPEPEFVMPHQHWSFDGIFGTYDRASLQRGFQVYKEVCSACHSMTRLSYRNLSDLGYTPDEVKAIAASVNVTDGPNDEGEMFERPGKPSDHFKSPFANVQAAKAANGGALPPDMSLLVKARHGGADYIYSILTGYEEAPASKNLLPGQYWNKAMHGNIIAMPAPLTPDRVAYGDGTTQSVDQYARDVAQFLTWASEPSMEERKRMGIKVFLFLLVFTGIMYGVKKKIWSNVH